MKLTLGYVGLTHLGVNYAIASAMKGFNVVCYDESLDVVSSLKKKKIPFYEKDTEKNLKKKFKQFKFTNKINDLKNCDLVFISQDVPTDINGKSNLLEIKKSIKKIIKVIKNKCNLIIMCQVPPGFTRSINWPLNNLYYQVETLIFSNALERALSPERIIVGNDSSMMSKKYNFFLKKFKCPIIEMNYESAELAKISINIFLISSVTSANILSEISENIGANWSDISNALKLDKRIGKYAYLKPGLGISGGVLGLAYKENTNSIKNSPSISFIKQISLNNRYTLNVFDPKIKKLSKYRNINICKNINDVMKNCEILLVATPWEIFKKIKLKKFKNIKAVIDPYNLINFSTDRKKTKYISMGN